ncbi:PaRep2b protein [Pyrobaculum aerophilum]|nr:PaRep2b protein [Pyrobaculum aerophilum]
MLKTLTRRAKADSVELYSGYLDALRRLKALRGAVDRRRKGKLTNTED